MEANLQKKSTQPRQDRTITVDFNNTETYQHLIGNGKAFIEFVVAFIISIDFQLKHKKNCPGGFSLTRHSHYARARLNDLIIWRIQCTHCKAVFTVLPHFVLRYRKMHPEIAEKTLRAACGGLSLELCSVLFNVSAMSVYRMMCGIGRHCLVTLISRCDIPLPPYLLADEKHAKCLGEKVYLPTIVTGRVIWHLGYVTDKSAAAFKGSYGKFRQSAQHLDPGYRVKGILTDGFESTIKSLRSLFPGVRIGNCVLHAAKKVNGKIKAIPSALRKNLSFQFYDLFQKALERKSMVIFSFSQKLRRFAEKVKKVAGTENADRISEWIKEKKTGWFALLEDVNIPATSTLLDQAHNAVDRKLFMMKGFHHKKGSQEQFINALAILHNLIPYQRRARNAGKCGIQVEGGKLPSRNWFLSLQILTSGGFQ